MFPSSVFAISTWTYLCMSNKHFLTWYLSLLWVVLSLNTTPQLPLGNGTALLYVYGYFLSHVQLKLCLIITSKFVTQSST